MRDLQGRIAVVSVKQIVLLFQSRTLESTLRLADIVLQREHIFYMQGDWACSKCGDTRAWPERTVCFRCGFRTDGSGCIAPMLMNAEESQDQLVPNLQSGPTRGTGNGLGRTQQSPTMRVPQAPPGPKTTTKEGGTSKMSQSKRLTPCRC